MTTLGQLVHQTRHLLAGAGGFTENVTALKAPVDASVTELPVVDAQGVGRGIVEVGFEQMRVKDADAAAGVLTLWPFGRGYNGTTAAAHAADAEIAIAPRWAASTVAAELNGVVTTLYPDLYAVREHEEEYPVSFGDPLALPADAVGVVAVFVQNGYSTSDAWVPTDEWRFEPDSGRSLWVRHARAGGLVRVVYAARPGLFDLSGAPEQDFEDVTGLPARVTDVLALGVAYRLASMVDLAGNAQLGAAARADGKEQSLGLQVARLLLAQFQARLEQERRVLLMEHPVRPHRTRS